MAKTVLIVGASSGIGMSTAQKYISKGDMVFNMSRRECDLTGVINIHCDVSEKESIEKAWNSFTEKSNKLDVFIYSAGFSMASPMEFVKDFDYRYLFEVNFFGYLNLLEKCIPYLKISEGVSCVVGSIAGIVPIAYDSFYSSSKAAINMFVSAMQLELIPQGIKVICVMPGGTKTNFTFKRKIYPIEDMKDYAIDMQNSTASLENIEQKGMSADKVAKTIYRKCNKILYSYIYASGIMNKIITLIVRILPQNILYLVVKAKYHLKT
jgi:short-subunit dehydrogenase